MTFYDRMRSSLMGLGLLILVALCIIAAGHDASLAQTPSATEQQATQEAPPPACDAKVQEKCTPNSGDTAWMLTSVALVLMMTIPGLGLFYGGMVRKKNVGDTIMTSFAITWTPRSSVTGPKGSHRPRRNAGLDWSSADWSR